MTILSAMTSPSNAPYPPDKTGLPTPLKVVLGLAIAIVVVAMIASYPKADPTPTSSFNGEPIIEQPESYEVLYEVEGTAPDGASLTYQTASGTSQQTGKRVPVVRADGQRGIELTLPPGAFVYISAQNQGAGELTCRITANGQVIAENTSSGEFAIVTCEGSLPELE